VLQQAARPGAGQQRYWQRHHRPRVSAGRRPPQHLLIPSVPRVSSMKRMKFTTAISVRETPTRIRNFPAGWEGEVDEAAAIEVCHFKAAKFVGPDAELHEK